jgi:hypothetical protein
MGVPVCTGLRPTNVRAARICSSRLALSKVLESSAARRASFM